MSALDTELWSGLRILAAILSPWGHLPAQARRRRRATAVGHAARKVGESAQRGQGRGPRGRHRFPLRSTRVPPRRRLRRHGVPCCRRRGTHAAGRAARLTRAAPRPRRRPAHWWTRRTPGGQRPQTDSVGGNAQVAATAAGTAKTWPMPRHRAAAHSACDRADGAAAVARAGLPVRGSGHRDGATPAPGRGHEPAHTGTGRTGAEVPHPPGGVDATDRGTPALPPPSGAGPAAQQAAVLGVRPRVPRTASPAVPWIRPAARRVPHLGPRRPQRPALPGSRDGIRPTRPDTTRSRALLVPPATPDGAAHAGGEEARAGLPPLSGRSWCQRRQPTATLSVSSSTAGAGRPAATFSLIRATAITTAATPRDSRTVTRPLLSPLVSVSM